MKRSTRAALGALPVLACLAITAAPAAHAATTPAATRAAGISVSAALPNTLTVAGHRGQPVTVWTKGTAPITMRPLDSRPVRFAGLRTGRAYNVYVGAEKAMIARTMTAAGRIIRATAARGTVPGTMQVTWRHLAPSAVSPDAVRYLVTATDADGATVRRIVRGVDTTTLTGLNPRARYRITVTPYLEGMRGAGTVAEFTPARVNTAIIEATSTVLTAAEVPVTQQEPEPPSRPAAASDHRPAVAPVSAVQSNSGASTPVPVPAPSMPAVPVPVPVPTPAPTPTPTPSIAPRTQLVCPDGWTDNGANCMQTSPYTYSTKPYSYETVMVESVMPVCYVNVNGQIVERQNCIRYIPQQQLVNEPGWTNTGSEWQRKDAPPAGWADNGSAYERTTAKIEVPA